MKIALQYVNDIHGKTQAVQVPFTEWEKLLDKIKRYEQALQIKTDLKEAFEQVQKIKKFPSLKRELVELNAILENRPETGTSLGNDTYKVRIAIKSKGKGKSGGARIITYVLIDNREIYLLTIYDKSEFDNIGDKTLKSIIISLHFKK